ncbi:hypothetical protein [Streptomyces blattellae]|uniref:hypothetical protein n=1 Tax=Streptomyces blattellae TaxID=2569855 RepID=UPI0012B79EEC|nr:hypothetical protein [Streptomyces blattellae]
MQKDLDAAVTGLEASQVVKEKLNEVLSKAVDAIEDPSTRPEDRAVYASIVAQVTATLKAAQDANTTSKERASYTRIVEGIAESLRRALNPDTAPEDRAFYLRLADELADAAESLQQMTPDERAYYMRVLETLANGLVTIQNPKTAPKNAQDRKQIQKALQETTDALATVRNPDASEQERNEAQRELDQRANSLKNPLYLELLQQLKQYKAPTACVQAVENRTLQAGWPDGTLWGLSDPSCAGTLAQGAQDEGSKWQALFACVQQSPFSTCVRFVPKE